MRCIYLLLFCLLAGYGTFAQEGVGFRDITLEEALQQAQTENKLVFMDCYTSWCGPCQEMTKKVFPQKAAGDYFNRRTGKEIRSSRLPHVPDYPSRRYDSTPSGGR